MTDSRAVLAALMAAAKDKSRSPEIRLSAACLMMRLALELPPKEKPASP